jgi:hypothetical protein
MAVWEIRYETCGGVEFTRRIFAPAQPSEKKAMGLLQRHVMEASGSAECTADQAPQVRILAMRKIDGATKSADNRIPTAPLEDPESGAGGHNADTHPFAHQLAQLEQHINAASASRQVQQQHVMADMLAEMRRSWKLAIGGSRASVHVIRDCLDRLDKLEGGSGGDLMTTARTVLDEYERAAAPTLIYESNHERRAEQP